MMQEAVKTPGDTQPLSLTLPGPRQMQELLTHIAATESVLLCVPMKS
jgi:hypothetical protein